MKKTLTLLFSLLLAGFVLAQNISVEFNVDMSVQEGEGAFDPAADSVSISGSFNGWNTTATYMSDPDEDLVYTVTVDTFTTGDTLFFKFVKGAGQYEANFSGHSSGNRFIVIPAANTTYTAFFSGDSVINETVSVTFAANLEYEIVSGRFDPLTDTLTLRGPFNGWAATDVMSQSVGDPNLYEITVDIPAGVGDTIQYKFNILPNGWEGGDNRLYVVTADDVTNGAYVERVFNDLTPDIITLNPVTIKFTVDVTNAVNSITGAPFTSIENVFMAGANPPLTWPGASWPDADSALVHFMYNDGTNGDATADDNIWTLMLDFPQYSPLRVEYKYGANWGLGGGSNDNESSVGTNHNIYMTSSLLTGTVNNVWSQMGDHDLVDVVTDVKELPGVVKTYSLGQNYPNPFNPTTNIRFSIPEEGLVTLKIFNILGQEVATLLNEVKTTGNYSVDFDASKLTSGTYIYQIKVNNFTSVKKMMLIK